MKENWMKTIELCRKYKISEVICGCWQFSQGHSQNPTPKTEAMKTLFALADSGVTAFDCADIYTGVEELLGEFRIEYGQKRGKKAQERIRIHTKFVPDLEMLPHLSRADVRAIVERSLKRLRMETLDLVQFHWWDWEIPGYVEVAGYLVELQREGKIRHLGVTNFDIAHLEVLLKSGLEVVSNQVQYSVLDRRPENGMIEFCRKGRIALLYYGTAAGGFLSEHWLDKPEPKGELANRSLMKYKLIIDDCGGWGVFQKLLWSLQRIADRNGIHSLTTVAQIFALKCSPLVSGIIVGSTGLSRVGTLAQLNKPLDGAWFWSDYDMWMGTFGICDYPGFFNTNLFKLAKKLEGDIYSLERIKDGKHARIMRYNLNAQ